ncbi:MAG: complex I subunit 1 family protein [Planctomycetaceae bacterium]
MTVLAAANSLGGWFGERGLSSGWAIALAAFIHAVILIHLFAVAPLIFVWLERKVSGRIQDRLGPTRVGGRFGWLQGLADGIKLIQKEDLVPQAADNMLFRMAPYIACVAAFGGFMVLPFADGWVAVVSDIGIFLLFAILSLEVLGIVLAGYSSGSKWSLFGGMREAAQMVSYEIPLALCGLVPLVALGTLNLGDIGRMQAGWFFPNWMIFANPFTFIAFFVYFTVATAANKRAPFDLAEAESELVGGFHTEYSGMRWMFFYMAEYGSMFLVSGVAVYLFLGGWYSGIAPLDDGVASLRAFGLAGSWFSNLIFMVVFITKASFLVFVQIWVRWTFPRLRIDQVMQTCLKYLLPMSCVLFVGVSIWPVLLVSGLGRTTLIDWPAGWSRPLGDRMPRQEAREEERVTRNAAGESVSEASVPRRGSTTQPRVASGASAPWVGSPTTGIDPVRVAQDVSIEIAAARPCCGTLSGFETSSCLETQGGAASPLTLGFVVKPLRGIEPGRVELVTRGHRPEGGPSLVTPSKGGAR